MESLKNKTVQGVKWSLINNLANSGVTFLIGIILARLLSPREFGVLGLIMVFIAISDIFISGGFVTALIRKTDARDSDYNTVFYCNLGVSIFCMLLFCMGATSIANFFNEPVLSHVTPVMSIVLLLHAFALIQRTIIVKNLDFKRETIISIISSLGGGAVGIGMALMNYGVWSLVGHQLSRQMLNTSLLWIYSSWKPKWLFSMRSFHELFYFSSKVLVAELINTLYKNLFSIIVGKMYSTTQLGQYNRAEQFSLIFTNNLAGVIARVAFPVLSHLKDDREKMVHSFRKIVLYTAIVTFSLVCGLAAVAKSLILVLVGYQWLESVEYLQIICCYGILYPLQQLNLITLNIYGRSDWLLKLEFIKKFLFIPVLVVGFYFELRYMLWAAVVYYYIEFIANSWYSERLMGYGTLKQIRDLFPIFMLSIIVALCMWSVVLLSMSSLATLILQCVVGLILFLGIYEWTSYQEYVEAKGIIRRWISL